MILCRAASSWMLMTWDNRQIKILKISDRLDDADRGVVEGRIAQTRKPIVPPSPTSARMISAYR